jgi:hypothetical protein
VQDYDGVSRYQQFFEFNVFFVFITSLGLLLFSNVVSQVFNFFTWTFPSEVHSFYLKEKTSG